MSLLPDMSVIASAATTGEQSKSSYAYKLKIGQKYF